MITLTAEALCGDGIVNGDEQCDAEPGSGFGCPGNDICVHCACQS